ncbi:MAG: protein-L-isoaspartate(D-aspartate) O-methyltransferase [Pseudomonadales bacterium]|nr:protein-L-isoaspartate(D-aspartate) O-methyltransferase [Pseudomonadales bacterium]
MTSLRTRDRLINRLREEGIRNEAVLDVMRNTPRHLFVDEALAHRAYEDTALPIGYNQTLSQPYIVARMTEALLANGPVKRVLEVGTGSGYQTAILAQLVDQVFSVERILPLQEQARERMVLLGLRNVKMKHADGGLGWPEKAPFDAIMVTAAPRELPEELLSQLADPGRMVIPVGPDEHQELVLVTKNKEGIKREALEAVRFVPLLGGATS